MSTDTLATRNHHSKQSSSIHQPLGSTENIYYLLDTLYCLNLVVFADISGALDVKPPHAENNLTQGRIMCQQRLALSIT
jgi:hypothetical protein